MNQHLFIAGLHKSGTSLLHDLIRGHPAVSGFSNTAAPQDEGQHLQSVFPLAKAYGGPGRFGFHPASHMTEHHRLATADNAATLLREWGRHWDVSKPVLVEKSPPNLLRMRFLQRLFPHCAFVVILRHPIAVSFATRKWSRTGIAELLNHTLLCYERCFDDRPFLNRVRILRYEDLVRAPRATLDGLFSWIGLEGYDFDAIVSDHNEAYLSWWQSQRDAHAASIGASRLAQFESRMNVYGYLLDEPFTVARSL